MDNIEKMRKVDGDSIKRIVEVRGNSGREKGNTKASQKQMNNVY